MAKQNTEKQYDGVDGHACRHNGYHRDQLARKGGKTIVGVTGICVLVIGYVLGACNFGASLGTKEHSSFHRRVELGPYVLTVSNDYDEFNLCLKTGGIIISQLKSEDEEDVIYRNYYIPENGIDWFCSLNFDRKNKRVCGSVYAMPFLGKEGGMPRYIYRDNDGDGQWDLFIDSSPDGNKRRFERVDYNWIEIR